MTHAKMTLRTLLILGLALAVVAPLLAQDWVGRARLSGIVTTEDGEPIEGAKVELHFGSPDGPGPEAVETNRNGRWSVLGLRNGQWVVDITKDEFVPSQGMLNAAESGRNETVRVSLRRIEDTEEAQRGREVMGNLERANMLLREGEFTEARELYLEVLPEIEEKSRPALQLGIAQTYLQEGDLDNAATYLNRVLEADPEDVTALRLLARVQGGSGDTEAAMGTLEQLIELDPQDTQSIQLMVNLLVEADREEEAERYMAMLPEGTEMDPTAFLNRGIEAYNAGELESALSYFDRAAAAAPNMADVYYYRGLAYLASGSMAEAKADFEKLLEVDPESEHAADAQEFIDNLP